MARKCAERNVEDRKLADLLPDPIRLALKAKKRMKTSVREFEALSEKEQGA